MAFELFYLTRTGTRYMAKVAAGERLVITRAEFGSGFLSVGLSERTALVEPLGEMAITKNRVEDNTMVLTAQFSNKKGDALLDPFHLAEIGLYGKIEGESDYPEALIAYANAKTADKADYIPATLTEFLINWVLTVSNAENVTVALDESLVYVTADAFGEELRKKADLVDGKVPEDQIPIPKITVDSQLSTTSVNPIQNKAVAAAIGDINTILDEINRDPQKKTELLDKTTAAAETDTLPIYSVADGESRQITLKSLAESLNITKLELFVHTCKGAKVTCTNGVATLENTGSCKFNLPDTGIWTVTCSHKGKSVSKTVEIYLDPRTDLYMMILDHIEVTTSPTKTLYEIGETFDPTGAVVTATYTDSTTEEVTTSCTWDKAVLEAGDTAAVVSYTLLGITETDSTTFTVRYLASIAVTTPPTKTDYITGDYFAPEGMKVTATYTDGTKKEVTGYTYTPTGKLGTENRIIISYTENGVSANIYYGVNLRKVYSDLTLNSWETISEIAKMGKAAEFWKVGDCKNLTLNGKVGNLTLDNFACTALILGFDHNTEYEESCTIHFQLGTASGKPIAFYSSGYDANDSDHLFKRSAYDSNVSGRATTYGYKNTIIRHQSLPEFNKSLPEDLTSVITPVDKYTNNSQYSNNPEITATKDNLFILSEKEIWGSNKGMTGNYCKQYDYYTAGNSPITIAYDGTDAKKSWCRDCGGNSYGDTDDSYGFVVGTNGERNTLTYWYGGAISPCFVVGGAEGV